MKTLTIIGGGLGTPELLTTEATNAIEAATRIYTTERLATAMQSLQPLIQCVSYHEIQECLLVDNSKDAAVIVSGDTGFFSLAKPLIQTLRAHYTIRLIPGISSMQAMCARLGTSYENMKVISTHGRKTSVLGPVSYHPKVLVLTGGGADAHAVLRSLYQAGLGDVRVSAGENLGLLDERIQIGTADSLLEGEFAPLTVLLIENENFASLTMRLRDEDFVRGEVPMTKEEVRCLAVEKLEVESSHIVYDIGAGSGSVSVALARKACDGFVYAIERGAEGCALIAGNRDKIGAYNIAVVSGTAPEALKELPPADKVFIGGSGGQMKAILEALAVNERFDICVSAITLESISEAVTELTQRGFKEIEVTCVNVAKSKPVGNYHMMMAQNPVYLINGRWKQSSF